MIRIPGIDMESLDTSALSETERRILSQKASSPVVYRYRSPEAFLFELKMRSRIVAAAYAMNASGADFQTFETTRGNGRYWTRTEAGGLRLNEGATPSDAIKDIFVNGRLYGFECATAMVVILYKAALDAMGEDAFNAYFRNLLLYDWQYDNDLNLISSSDLSEAYPGDVLYFRNPDHDPDKPEWQGENVIKLADDLYFGHGIGIGSGQDMIRALNRTRRPGSTVSAFLDDQVDHPDFEHLLALASPRTARIGASVYRFILA